MSWAIWMTGRAGGGLPRAAAAQLAASGESVRLLELHEVRAILTPAPCEPEAEREMLDRALVFLAATLVDTGTRVIVDATGHRQAAPDLARAVIPRFAEVDLDTSRSLETILSLARSLTPPGELRLGTPPARWVIWITGLPGSGKTTLAIGAARALAARGAPVRVLDIADVRAALLGPIWSGVVADDIVYRTAVYAARRLAEAGVGVIVDATAPRRAWRDLARAAIGRFAEVQLICSRDVCLSRERSGRWGLGGGFVPGLPALRERARTPRIAPISSDRRSGAPDLVLDYEQALRPELTLYTEAQDPWASLQDVLRLAERLERAAAESRRIATAS